MIAVPDPIRGEEVKAYIVLKSPATPESVPPEKIWEFCKPHLAAYKVPRYLEYRGELPKTPSSKVQKNILRDESKQRQCDEYLTAYGTSILNETVVRNCRLGFMFQLTAAEWET